MAVAHSCKLENVLDKTDQIDRIDRIDITCPICKKVFQVSSNWVEEKGIIEGITCPINKCKLNFKNGEFISINKKKKEAA